VIYDLLFKASSETVLAIAADPKHLGARIGITAVLHTGSLPEGKSLAENTEFDLAILDVNLDGWNVLPVAQAIEERGVPILFVSGYKRTDLPTPFRDRLLVEKPIEIAKLKAAISEVLGGETAR
jgi:DNA-binding response OmpR family regulator